jgi:hypothetical protein
MNTEPSPIPLEALPAALRELVRVLGHADAFRLIAANGGGRLSIPKRPTPDHPLRMVLSAEGFDVLVAWAGGETMDLPKGDAYMRELRHHQVREIRASGLTMEETARATGYSRRQVINITGGEGTSRDTRTRDMFEEAEDEGAVGGRKADKAPVSTWAGQGDPFGHHGR